MDKKQLREAYRELARLGGEACKKKHGPGHYRELGRKGGRALLEKRGAKFFKKIGAAGGAKGIGLHARWHVNRGIVNPACRFCTTEEPSARIT